MQYVCGDVINAQNTLLEESERKKPVGRILCICIILKLILNKYGGLVWTECSYLRTEKRDRIDSLIINPRFLRTV